MLASRSMRSPSRGSRALRPAVWLTLLLLSSPASAQLSPQPLPTTRGVQLPLREEAAEALVRGDRACLLALEGGPAAEGRWTEAFEAWHSALVESAPGDAVPVGPRLPQGERNREPLLERAAALWPDRDHSFARRTEAVEVAVLRRLAGLEPERRAPWTRRFEGLAAERLGEGRATLEAGQGPARWARVERLFPATRAALAAAVARFELDFEAGRPRQAAAWLERAERHGALLGLAPEDPWTRGLEGRRAVLDRELLAPTRSAPPWTRASLFRPEPDGGHTLTRPGFAKPRALARVEGQPGLCFLDDERVAVQTTGTVWVLDPRDEHRIFEPWRLAEELGQPIASSLSRTGRGWPFFPTGRGDDLFLVSGRADREAGNLLQRVRTPRHIELPVAVWSLGGAGLVQRDPLTDEVRRLPLEEVLEAGLWEFQPGPLLVEDLLLVQARQWSLLERDGRREVGSPGEARVWLLALEAASGAPHWKRLLCRGSDLVDDFGFGLPRATLVETPGEALEATRGGVFVGTNLGAGLLLDLADGRLRWALQNRRRDPSEPGARAGGRPGTRVSSSAQGEQLLWAPADSRRLYALSTALDFAPTGAPAPPPLVPWPPVDLEGGELLLGGRPGEALVLGAAGARRTLSAHDLTRGRRYDSIYLARGEGWLPGALLTDGKVLFAAEGGLYRLDRQRELYLESFQPLAVASDFAAGGLWARGEHLYLLAMGALLHFRTP